MITVFVFAIALAVVAPANAPGAEMARIRVNTDRTVHTMASGIGASWPALSRDITLENERYPHPAREENARGSVWGGNPPAADTGAWDQIE